MRDRLLPRVLDATGVPLPFESEDDGWLLRDLDLASLVQLTESRHPWLAVDLDSVEGLNADAAAVRFVVSGLHVNAVVSRRPGVVQLASELGAIGLVRVFAFDSTGLRRSLEPIDARARVGAVVSPGIVLPYVGHEQQRALPRPLVAYGLIEREEQAADLLGIADSVVLRPDLAAAARASERRRAGADHPVGGVAMTY